MSCLPGIVRTGAPSRSTKSLAARNWAGRARCVISPDSTTTAGRCCAASPPRRQLPPACPSRHAASDRSSIMCRRAAVSARTCCRRRACRPAYPPALLRTAEAAAGCCPRRASRSARREPRNLSRYAGAAVAVRAVAWQKPCKVVEGAIGNDAHRATGGMRGLGHRVETAIAADRDHRRTACHRRRCGIGGHPRQISRPSNH